MYYKLQLIKPLSYPVVYNEKLPSKIIKASWNYFFDSRKTYSVFWHSLFESWNHIFPINLPSSTLITGDQAACGGKKKKHWRKDGLPLLWASGLNCSARARIQTKAIKASASDTFPKQDCGTHFPSLEWDLHGDADITRLGKVLSSACVVRFS